MESIQSQGIVLRYWDYGEKDLIVSFVSPEWGRLQGIAKGAKASRKRFGPALDLFVWSEFFFQERKSSNLVFIEKLSPISLFEKIRLNYQSILYALGFLEMNYKFYPEAQKDVQSFEVLLQGLQNLEKYGASSAVFWHCLLSHLQTMGIYPDLREEINSEVNPSFLPTLIDYLKVPASLLNARLSEREEEMLLSFFDSHLKKYLHFEFDFQRFLRVS